MTVGKSRNDAGRLKLVEEIFGWAKTVGGLRKAKFIGLARVKAQTVFTLAAYT